MFLAKKNLKIRVILFVLAMHFIAYSVRGSAHPNQSEICPANAYGFCIGDRVINSSKEIGTITQIFRGSYLLIHFDQEIRSEIVSAESVNRSVNCSGPICRGQRVTNFLNQQGLVNEVFSNGVAEIILLPSQRVVLRKVNEISLDRSITPSPLEVTP